MFAEKRPNHGLLRLVLEQEGIVAVVAGNLAVGDGPARGPCRVRRLLEVIRRIQPVGREREEQKRRVAAAEGVAERAPGRSQVEIVNRAGEIEQRVRVEAIHEGLALVFQVALDLELAPEAGTAGRRYGGGGRTSAASPRPTDT